MQERPEETTTSPASVRLETLTEAIDRLGQAGFQGSFQAQEGRLLHLDSGRSFAPEEMIVREIVRFEGDSDPGDTTVLFALRAADGSASGTLVGGYGTSVDPDTAAVISQLDAAHAKATRERERDLTSSDSPGAGGGST